MRAAVRRELDTVELAALPVLHGPADGAKIHVPAADVRLFLGEPQLAAAGVVSIFQRRQEGAGEPAHCAVSPSPSAGTNRVQAARATS